MQTDIIEDTKEGEDGLLIEIKVAGYGLSVDSELREDPIQGNGYASILLDKNEAKKLLKALEDYVR